MALSEDLQESTPPSHSGLPIDPFVGGIVAADPLPRSISMHA